MQKIADAYAMRIRGATWDEIARAVGYANPQNAMRAVRRYVGTLPRPEMGELRSMWRDRLEYLWPLATRDVEAGKPGAVRAAVAVAQRAAQLDGLDAPTRFEVTPTEEQYEALVTEVLRARGVEELTEYDILAIEADVVDADVVDE
ncbi:hypothetical protein IF188_08250 [Microbacterium sp. NEAU-LLC]|uniref:Uncharacterized protein n=1 Tax=Microbacterium helvum TaxID=2773713 RepID=A0ABR8NNY8_9MICO|nr:hypothetical protein [Microbacterium helvum]MBD3941683.1 hypothetical protein [Microbacterium helvum]